MFYVGFLSKRKKKKELVSRVYMSLGASRVETFVFLYYSVQCETQRVFLFPTRGTFFEVLRVYD